jgi:hypothetical protein
MVGGCTFVSTGTGGTLKIGSLNGKFGTKYEESYLSSSAAFLLAWRLPLGVNDMMNAAVIR